MVRRKRRSKRSWLRSLTLGLTVSGALLLALEFFLASIGAPAAFDTMPFVQWTMGKDLESYRIIGPVQPHDFRVSTNEDGLRTSYSRLSQASFRVVLLGDSNVFGWGVDDEDSYGPVLERHLATLRGDEGVQVINAGQPGGSTTHVALFFEAVVGAYRPDLVVLVPPMHDHNRVLVSDREAIEGGRGPGARLRILLVCHSRIYQVLRSWLVRDAAASYRLPDADSDGVVLDWRVPRVSDEERRVNLDAIRTQAGTWEGDFAVALLPQYADLQIAPVGVALGRPGIEWLESYAKDERIALLDVRTCCGPDPDSQVFPYDVGHLNAEGIDRSAFALAQALQTLLPPIGIEAPEEDSHAP